jgi:hypothetical protein
MFAPPSNQNNAPPTLCQCLAPPPFRSSSATGYKFVAGKSKRNSPPRHVEAGLKHNRRCTLRIPSRCCLCELATSLGKSINDLWPIVNEDRKDFEQSCMCFLIFCVYLCVVHIFSFSKNETYQVKMCCKTHLIFLD